MFENKDCGGTLPYLDRTGRGKSHVMYVVGWRGLVIVNLVSSLSIDGLGKESLPRFLNHHKLQSEPDVSEEADEAGQVKKRRRITAPSNKTKWHNTIDVITRELKELAKHDPKVYEMIFPQLEEMLQNAKMVHNTSSSKQVQMCQEHIKKTGVTVAAVPGSIRRNKSDDVNRANSTQTSSKKSKNMK